MTYYIIYYVSVSAVSRFSLTREGQGYFIIVINKAFKSMCARMVGREAEIPFGGIYISSCYLPVQRTATMYYIGQGYIIYVYIYIRTQWWRSEKGI